MFRRCVTDRVVQKVRSASTTSLHQRLVVPSHPGFCHRLLSKVRFLRLAGATILLLSPSSAWAQTSNWVLPANQSGDWSVGSNWDSGVPTGSTSAYIANGGAAMLTLAGETCRNLDINNSSLLQMTSGSLSAAFQRVGDTTSGTFTQSGGSNSSLGIELDSATMSARPGLTIYPALAT